MARRGSSIAEALDRTAAPGVVPAAFDTALIGSNPADFVYRSLDNSSLDIVSGPCRKYGGIVGDQRGAAR